MYLKRSLLKQRMGMFGKPMFHGKLNHMLAGGERVLTLVNSQTARQDRTWKSTQGIFFADAKVKAWSPSNGIRFSDGPSPPLPSRAEARKLFGSARTMAADESSIDITDTTRQYEPSLGRDSILVEVAGTEKTRSEEPHQGNMDSRRTVAGPVKELGHQCAQQSLSVPLNAMVSSCASKRRAVTRSPVSPDPGLSDTAKLPSVSLDRRVESAVRSNQTMKIADKPNPSMVDRADLSRMSKVCTARQRSAYNRAPQTKRGNGSQLAISAFVTHNMRHRFSEATRIQEYQRSLLNNVLEIDRLLRESIALPDLTFKLRDLHSHLRSYCEEVDTKLSDYRIALAMVDSSRKLVKWSNRSTHHSNVIMLKLSSMADARNFWESPFLAPYTRISQSPKILWRAIRSSLTFRGMFGRTRNPNKGRRIRQVLARFRALTRIFTDDRSFRRASLDAQKRFSRQYSNADARASALQFKVTPSEVNSNWNMLTDSCLRHGLVSTGGSPRSRTGKWRRIMLHMKKSFEDHATELHRLIRTVESDLLDSPRASKVNQRTFINKQDLTDIASKCKLRLTLMVSELCQELRRGRRFAQYFEDIVAQRPHIDIRKDMLRMLEEPYPVEARPAAAIAGTDSGRCVVPPSEDRDSETCCRGKNGLSSSGSLGFQCSAPLTYSDLSSLKYLIESEPYYPVIDGLQFASRPADYGTNENGRSAMEDSAESSTLSEDLPFSTPLGYHIPKAKLQRAIDAAPSGTAAYWQYTLYQGPGGERDKVKVHYCKSKDSTERISQLFLHEEVIGFDIEWKMNATATDGVKKNVALIQIASEERIALFHIARYPNATDVDDFVAPTFKRIMESANITKVGVSVKGDCTRLRKFMNIEAHGIFELSHLYKLVKFSCGDVKKINKVMVSLAQQVEEHLQLPLWKGEVRSSDWSQDLDYQQIQCEPSCFTAVEEHPSK